MSLRRSSIVLAVIGLLLIVSAGIFRFAVVPSMSKLPSNFSQTLHVEGTMTAVNPQAMATGDFANLSTPAAPYKAIRKLTVDAVDGNTAIVTNAVAIDLPGGAKQNDVHTFAIDRSSLKPVNLTDAQVGDLVPANRKATFEKHSGYAFGFPRNLSTAPLAIYDTVIREDRPAQMTTKKTVEGRDVYEFRIDNTGPVRDPAITAGFAQLPKMMPKAMIGGLLASGNIPAQSAAAVSADMATMPDMLATSVVSTTSGTLGIDEQFGAPVTAEQTQNMYLAVPVDGVATPVMQLSSVVLTVPPAETSALIDTLNGNSTTFDIANIWGPLAVAVVGLVLLAIAVIRRRKPVISPVAPATRTEDHLNQVS